MRRKINILIILSLAALIALSAIQYYLMNDAYAVKKAAFTKVVSKQMKFLDANESFDALDDAYVQFLKNELVSNPNSFSSKEKMIIAFKPFMDSINKEFNIHYKKELESKKLDYHIGYQKNIKSFLLVNTINKDTLISINEAGLLLFGTNIEIDERLFLSSGSWETSNITISDKAEVAENQNFLVLINSESYVSVPNFKSIIFKKMGVLLVLSIMSLLVVISLFVYAIRSFIAQKKISDIKSDFINNITHELKTPLATLSVASKTLRNKHIQENEKIFISTLDAVDRQNSRLQGLIDQVVQEAVEYKHMSLDKKPVSINAMFTELVSDFKITHTSIELNTNLLSEELIVPLDRFHFTTAIQNILVNAAKYGANIISVVLEKTTSLHIIITDNGMGISKTDLPFVFDKFFRVQEGNIHNVKGLGLGLFYVKQLITAHEGTVSIESKLQEGTKLIITLPLL